MSASFLDSLTPFSAGEVRTMLRPGDVVTQPLWPSVPVRKVHVIRIGGAGMSAVARLALDAGFEVTGSESQDGQFLAPLRAKGARIVVGFAAENLDADTDVVVVSTAVRADNPEVIRARELGIPVIHRAAGLAGLLAGKRLVAIAGTHGKTTTTAMTTLALRGAGLDPAWAVGAAVDQLGANSGFGTSDLAVIEADESDGSFVAFAPEVLVVTNFEIDHVDFHGNEANLRAVFSAFISRLKETGGALVACADDEGARKLALEARSHGITVVLYGEHEESDWRVIGDSSSALGARILVRASDANEGAAIERELVLRVPGHHNALNALGALVAGHMLGFDVDALIAGLGEFTGAQRRFQVAGEVRGTAVVDDYAHHPREVAVTVAAAREAAGEGEVVAVFQPHLFSRTKAFTSEFAQSLASADHVVLLPIYPAREDFDPSIRSEDLAALVSGPKSVEVVQRESAPARIAELAGDARIVLMMGAGDIVELSPEVLAALEDRV